MKIAPKKNLGQNFLIDENVIDQIIDIANISRRRFCARSWAWNWSSYKKNNRKKT